MVAFADHLIGHADVLTSQVDANTKEVTFNLGDSRSDKGVGAASEYWGIDGFISRPNDPGTSDDDDGACQAIYLQDGQVKRVIGTQDYRYTKFAGNLEEGDRAIVTNCPARVWLKKKRDAVVLYTERRDEEQDKSMMIDMDGENGVVTISCGNGFVRIDNETCTLGVNGGSTLQLQKDGNVSIKGQYFQCATAGGMLGCMPGEVPPVKPVNSILYGPSGMMGVASLNWVIGP